MAYIDFLFEPETVEIVGQPDKELKSRFVEIIRKLVGAILQNRVHHKSWK